MHPLTKWLAMGTGLAGAAYAANVADNWLRYGQPGAAREDAKDALLDKFMRDYDVRDRRESAFASPAETTLAAAIELDLGGSPVVRALFTGRAWLLGGKAAPSVPKGQPNGLVASMKSMGWGVLAEEPGREIVMGGVTKPWEANPVFRAPSPEQFAGFHEPDCVKIAWTLRAVPNVSGGSTFSTETRAIATDDAARRKFRAYWSFLSPGIIVIRLAMLQSLKEAAERQWRVEGDDIVGNAQTQLTHAVTIDAPPRAVWPLLLQMGCQRAGWYSWDLLDNAGVRSADKVVPSLQHLAVGDVLPARPVGSAGFTVLRIVPERALVLDGAAPHWKGTWAFELQPLDANRTRLVTRYRAASPPSAGWSLMVPTLSAVHAFMERKQLQTIKHHAEHSYALA